ncbi:hypothetical protein BH09CHL1_BH09CHL1_21050 [soil metagenome]
MIPSYNVRSYRLIVQMSSLKRLLVEGRDDRIALRCLVDAILGSDSEVVIDIAEMISTDGLSARGNREKVEAICSEIRNHTQNNRPFSGFVDREYREFDTDNILDLAPAPHSERFLSRSRGHSIENYWFSFDIFREALKAIAVTPHFPEAIRLFESRFESSLKLACAASLAANELGMHDAIRRGIGWECLEVSNDGFDVDDALFKSQLIQRMSTTTAMASSISSTVRKWYHQAAKADVDAARWISHGHIGLSVLWACYAASVFHVSNSSEEARAVYALAEGPRSNACANAWSRSAAAGNAAAPWELITAIQ